MCDPFGFGSVTRRRRRAQRRPRPHRSRPSKAPIPRSTSSSTALPRATTRACSGCCASPSPEPRRMSPMSALAAGASWRIVAWSSRSTASATTGRPPATRPRCARSAGS